MVILLLPLVVSYKRKYVHEVQANRLLKNAQENLWLGELTIAVYWDVKPQTKHTKKHILNFDHDVNSDLQ